MRQSSPPQGGLTTWARAVAATLVAACLVVAVVVLWGRDLGLRDLLYGAFRPLATPETTRTWESLAEMAAGREGEARYAAGDHDAAIRSFARAIELSGPEKPTTAWYYRRRAAALAGAGRKQEALADHDKAIALQPDLAAAYHDRGTLLSDLGRYDDALRDFATVLRRNPTSDDTLIAPRPTFGEDRPA